MKTPKNRMVLIVIDGWGENPDTFGNAIAQADTPHMDRLKKEWAHTTVLASGEAVGLPAGQQGNSEVGHLTIGSGRVIHQDLGLQKHAIESGTFFENEILTDAIERAKERGASLHVMGLVSPGGVHSHQDSAVAVTRLAHQLGLSDVFIHAFTDGRDTPPASAKKHIEKLEKEIEEVGVGRVASVSGRYYAMDRDSRWERTQQVYEMLTGVDHPAHESAVDYIAQRYQDNQTDEFLSPISIANDSSDRVRLEDGDVVVFFNFRPDRARQLSHALVDADFKDFKRDRVVKDLHVVTFTEYDKSLGVPVLFPKEDVGNGLSEVVSKAGFSQFHVAETEKYAHVTYFFNGGREAPFRGEDRRMIPSPKIGTYDEDPAMSAEAVADAVVERLGSDHDDALIVVNFANPDMVGHTGDFDATKQAVEVTDACIGVIVGSAVESGYSVLITADHGNAEIVIDKKDNSPVTSHSVSPVPVVLCGTASKKLRANGSLQDIAPTILCELGLDVPGDMTGRDLRSNLLSVRRSL